MIWPEARTAGTYKDMVREFGATNFTQVEDEARYWLDTFEPQQVEEAMVDAGYGYNFASQTLCDVIG